MSFFPIHKVSPIVSNDSTTSKENCYFLFYFTGHIGEHLVQVYLFYKEPQFKAGINLLLENKDMEE